MRFNLNVDFTKMSKYEIIAHITEMKTELREKHDLLIADLPIETALRGFIEEILGE